MIKRIDYFFPRAAVQIFGILFFTQLITDFIATRKAGYEWVIYICGIAFLLSLVWSLTVIFLNSVNRKEQS